MGCEFWHLQPFTKRQEKKMEFLLYYRNVFSTPSEPLFLLTVHYLRENVSRLYWAAAAATYTASNCLPICNVQSGDKVDI